MQYTVYIYAIPYMIQFLLYEAVLLLIRVTTCESKSGNLITHTE